MFSTPITIRCLLFQPVSGILAKVNLVGLANAILVQLMITSVCVNESKKIFMNSNVNFKADKQLLACSSRLTWSKPVVGKCLDTEHNQLEANSS